ncbi:unnamed protein product, partial [Ectocarpus sp. 4 AP-2014]
AQCSRKLGRVTTEERRWFSDTRQTKHPTQVDPRSLLLYTKWFTGRREMRRSFNGARPKKKHSQFHSPFVRFARPGMLDDWKSDPRSTTRHETKIHSCPIFALSLSPLMKN